MYQCNIRRCADALRERAVLVLVEIDGGDMRRRGHGREPADHAVADLSQTADDDAVPPAFGKRHGAQTGSERAGISGGIERLDGGECAQDGEMVARSEDTGGGSARRANMERPHMKVLLELA